MSIAGLIVVVLLFVLFFSVIFAVTGILTVLGSVALAISFLYYNITHGSLVNGLWAIPILLSLFIGVLIMLGWLSIIPPKFDREKKASFKVRFFNIIMLIFAIALILVFFSPGNILMLNLETPSLAI